MNISTDAISLDGLLDSVSSGSFSDLPSPNDLKSKIFSMFELINPIYIQRSFIPISLLRWTTDINLLELTY